MLRGRELPVVPDLHTLNELVRCRPGLFLRQSEGPEVDLLSPTSRDYESGVEMPGLSVTTIAPEPWWPRPAIDWLARRICKYADLGLTEQRRPWLLQGRVVGRGPDHEPLVTDVQPVAWLDDTVIREARDRYQSCFDVGNDSKNGHRRRRVAS
ncbi:DUF6098 family protein [Phytoactinopolyspora mesophila]|uniref:Uncharacterized protein n=1 Tax=Phytoactinopolyspora mesophila TaxID=2650750 RepID=A0A7K3M563_9ACTN|nr:DUF6098 family protein [Phytoactinopolyspora mesophila]NDL57578.1 hypothetical protein [Phytoactinopolyspora mesophila]